MNYYGRITSPEQQDGRYEASFTGLPFNPMLAAENMRANETMSSVDDIDAKITFNSIKVYCDSDEYRADPDVWQQMEWEFTAVSRHPLGNEYPPENSP